MLVAKTHWFYLAAVVLVLAWSGIAPYERFTWYLEVAPVLIIVPLLLITYRRFPLTDILYALIALHMIVLAVGGHYTYARVPCFEWLREPFGFTRNHYDRFGHFMQGFVPALVGRELLLRTSNLGRGRWMVAILLLSCLGISAFYELLEWAVDAHVSGGAGEFLGMQGDPWDAQKDMLMALIGAASSLLLLSGVHDRQLGRLKNT